MTLIGIESGNGSSPAESPGTSPADMPRSGGKLRDSAALSSLARRATLPALNMLVGSPARRLRMSSTDRSIASGSGLLSDSA